MICAKNYETVSKFVKVMPRILVASFFPGHGVHAVIVVSTLSINGSNMFSSLSNAALSIGKIDLNSAVSSATSSSIRVSQKPNCGRLAIQGRVQHSSNVVSFYVFASPTANR